MSLTPSGLFGFGVARRDDVPGGTIFTISTPEGGEVVKLELDAAVSLELTLMFVNATAIGTQMREIGDPMD